MCSYDVELCFVLLCFAFVPIRTSTTITAFVSGKDNSPTPDMARENGYSCETHEVVTEDGYLLHVHRLPGGKIKPLEHSLMPVFLQHGLFDSSADWLMSGPSKGLGYLLADKGYDVWLGNARGNTYSRQHRNLSSNDPRFWNWTWHEMGYYDLPAVIDYILEKTGHTQIYYVGHSMGTTMFFVLCSTRPEYNAKVRYMAALAPIAYMGRTKSPIRILTKFSSSLEKIADFFGNGEFLPRNKLVNFIFKLSCEAFEFEERICENYLFLICGYDPAQFDVTLLPVVLGHNPAGTSTKTLVHYSQEITSTNFHQYDYGPEKNILLYNSTTPPKYNLSQITVPLSLHYGDNDLLANPLDVNLLFKHLKSPIGMFRVNLSSFNHLDFMWGRDAKQLVYEKVETLLKAYGGSSPPCFDEKSIIEAGLPELMSHKVQSCMSETF